MLIFIKAETQETPLSHGREEGRRVVMHTMLSSLKNSYSRIVAKLILCLFTKPEGRLQRLRRV